MAKEREDRRSALQLSRNKYLMRDAFQMWIATKAKSNGKDIFRRISGYYSTYESLFEGYVREQGKLISGDTVEEQLAEFAKMEKQLKSYAKKIGKELDENRG